MLWSRFSTKVDPLVISSITATAGRKADSTGRCNTFHHILFEQPVESFCQCLPAQCFSGARVQSVSNGAQFFRAMFAEIRALGEVLAEQTVGILVAATLPRALRIAEVNSRPVSMRSCAYWAISAP